MQKVSREDLQRSDDEVVVSEDSFHYDFDFDIVDIQEDHLSESDDASPVNHTFQLFSNSTKKEIEILPEEEEDINSYFIDTSKRDAEWDQIASSRKRPESFYISTTGEDQRLKFEACAVSGEDIWLGHLLPSIKLQVDIERDAKKIITNDPIVIKKKNKRGLQSRLKFKAYQDKLSKLKEAKRKQKPPTTSIPSKKPFLNSKQPKFKSSSLPSSGKPKFRTES